MLKITTLSSLPGGTPRKTFNWVGLCGPLQNLRFSPTLFMTRTKIGYTLFMTVAAETVALNIICEGLLFMVLSIMMKKLLLLKKHIKFKTRAQKPYPI